MPVIFKEDWGRYNAVADLTTRNRTFVHMARVLQSMGVENHMFMLALVDQELLGVDPHAPNLTQDQVMRISNECYINPWYFFREVCRAPASSGKDSRPFMANRGNLALYFCFLNHIMTLIIQARQTGKSFSTDCMLVWLMMIRCRGTTINILTKDEKLRKSNIARIKDIMGALPKYMDFRDRKDAFNTEMVTVKFHGNTIYTHLPTKDKKAADNIGRGMTSAIAVIDEPPYQPNIHIALPVALSSGGMACELAEEAGDPWGTIFTTTAAKKDTPEGKYFYDFMMNMTEWNEKLFDCKNLDDLKLTIRQASRADEPEDRVAIVFNHRQLGYTDEWLKARLARSTSSGENADRDYFNRWTSGSTDHPLTVKQLETIVGSQQEPKFVERTKIGGYMVRWYIPEDQIERRMAENHHLAAFDTSNAGGGDAISMRITDLYTGECMATATINHANLTTISEWMASLLLRFLNMTMLIENRSTGAGVLDLLLRFLPTVKIDPFKRLFNRVVNEPSDHPELAEESRWPLWRRNHEDYYVRVKKRFGFATSGSGVTSRSGIYGEVLHSAAAMVGHLVVDGTTISQIAGLIRKNNRVDHPAGSHDDMVIGWALTHWFCIRAQNLSFYGIEASRVLQSVRQIEVITPQERLHRMHQKRYRDRAGELMRMLRETTDPMVASRYEHELRVVYSCIEEDDAEKFSVDELIDAAKQQRNRQRVLDSRRSFGANVMGGSSFGSSGQGVGSSIGGYGSAHARAFQRNQNFRMT